MIEDAKTAQEKALHINLDASRYGVFAEIGASQEVARWFFHVGKASATVAKSISAYDMAISNTLYGKADQYVSRARLEAMLDREYSLLVEELDNSRGEKSAFFVFADTVATHGSLRASGGHGWVGVRFQDRPREKPSEIILHVEVLDAFMTSQHETMGLLGVNLIYGAFTWHRDPVRLIQSLMEGLDRRRIEIDVIKLSGPVFSGVDNRLVSLQLVELGATDVAMFTAGGEVVQPSEVLHNRPVLIERGSFRPVTNVMLNMLDAAAAQLPQNGGAAFEAPVVLMEMTLNNLTSSDQKIDHQDFLARADTLAALGKTVMISNYTRFDLVTTYLRQYTKSCIGMVAGIPTVRAIFDERYYTDLKGGILEGLGRLFNGPVKLLAFPAMSAGGELETADTFVLEGRLHHLYAYLFENGFIEPIRQFSTEQLRVTPGEVLSRIQSGDMGWLECVPAEAAALIQREGFFATGSA